MRTVGPGSVAVVAVPFVLLAAAAPAALADDAQALGKIKSVAEDGASFELKGKKSSARVELGADTKLVRIDAPITLAKLEAGTKVHILGRKADAYRNPDTGQVEAPKRIEQVRTIVAGEGFTPPPLDDTQRKQGLEWHEGPVVARGTAELLLDGHVIMGGRARPVIVHEAAEPTDVKKNAIVLVAGEKSGKGKDTVIAASRVTFIGKRIPAAELPLVLGGS